MIASLEREMTVKQLHLGLGPVRRVDYNNFYANYEKLFRPDLRDTTVFVLSSNDSCVVARSKEAKAGIPPQRLLQQGCNAAGSVYPADDQPERLKINAGGRPH